MSDATLQKGTTTRFRSATEESPQARRVLIGTAFIGLAILVSFFRTRGSIAVEDANVMKG